MIGYSDLKALSQADLLLLAARFFTPPTSPLTDNSFSVMPGAAGLENPSNIPCLEPAEGLTLAARAGVKTKTSVQATLQEMLHTSNEDLMREHSRLFESAGACPPNETVYIRRDKGAILADLCGFYRAFGFVHDPGQGEKADHIACELEFVALLIVMRVRAAMEAEDEPEEICTRALGAFAADHLGEWLPTFCTALGNLAHLEPLRHLAVWLPELWQAVILHHQLPEFSATQSLGPLPDAGDPYECGMSPSSLENQ